MEAIYHWRGQQRYRCQKCHRSFYARIPQEDRLRFKQSEEIRRKRTRGWNGFIQTKLHRKVMEAVFFLGMLFLVYMAFRSFMSRDGVGVFSHTSESQP